MPHFYLNIFVHEHPNIAASTHIHLSFNVKSQGLFTVLVKQVFILNLKQKCKKRYREVEL